MSEHAITRYRPSPRTAALPMAFTGQEFARGALAAWGWFLALFAPVACLHYAVYVVSGPTSYWSVSSTGFAMIPVVLLAGYCYVVPWSLAGLLVGMPLAYGIGLALRRVQSRTIHLAVFGTLGMIVGAGATTAEAFRNSSTVATLPSEAIWAIPIYAVLASISVLLGWMYTVGHALMADRSIDPVT
jgi:hypothetical protein